MLRREELRALYASYAYEPDDETRELYPTDRISAELALQILLTQDMTEEAVNLMASAIMPRVGVWWAYLCLQMVFEDIRKDFEKDGLTPRERRAKKVEAMVKELSDTSDIDKKVEAHRQATEAYVKELEEAAKNQGYLNPLERMAAKMQWLDKEFKIFKKKLPPGSFDERSDTDGNSALEKMVSERLDSIKASWNRRFEQLEKDDKLPEGMPNTDDIFEAIRKKTGAIGPAVDKEMAKHFPLKLRGLPKPVSPARKTAAVEAALRWLLVPSDENGKLACDAAMAAKAGPESMLAYTAFWASTNLVTETGVAPTNLALPPMGISKTLLQLALMEGGEMDYDARYKEFLRLGIECADNTCTWDEHGKVVRHGGGEAPPRREDHVFRTRYGFGRE